MRQRGLGKTTWIGVLLLAAGCPDPDPGPEPCPGNIRPREISAATVGDEVQISWEDRNSSMGYRIERGTPDGYELVGEADDPPYADDTVEPDRRYTYRVVAYRDEGCQAPTEQLATAYGPPHAPAGLSIELFDFVGFFLEWEDTNTFESEYVILEAEGQNPDPSAYQEVVRRGPGTVREAFGGHRYDTLYSVVVGATNPSTLEPVRSEPVTILTAPAPVEFLRYTALSPTAGRLEWSQVSDDATAVEIRRRRSTDFFYEVHAELGPDAESFDDELEPGVFYDWRVFVINPAGYSPRSEISGSGFIPPTLRWNDDVYIDESCLMQVRGNVDYDDVNGAVYDSATGMVDGSAATGMHNRVEANLGAPRTGTIDVSWSVTDTLGGQGSLDGQVELFVEEGGEVVTLGAPARSLGADAAEGRQPLLPAEPDLAGTCGRTCIGPRASLALGDRFSCALADVGRPRCWGSSDDGRTGLGTAGDVSLPSDVCTDAGCTTFLDDIEQLSAAGGTACGLNSDGQVFCWGAGAAGQLGDGEATARAWAAPVCMAGTLTDGCNAGADVLDDVVQVAVGASHACALAGDGRVFCWGDDTWGQLGDGQEGPGNAEATVVCAQGQAPACTTELNGVLQLAAGDRHTCALLESGGISCWGSQEDGQLGDGSLGAALLTANPVPVGCGEAPAASCDGGALIGALSVAAGRAHTCAIVGAGDVLCWGAGAAGQLGDGDQAASSSPVAPCAAGGACPDAAAFEGAASVAVAGDATCVLGQDGSVHCWGDGLPGGVRAGPEAVCESGLATTCDDDNEALLGLALAVGPTHVCLASAAGVQCWGSDDDGELGAGELLTSSAAPVAVCAAEAGCALDDGAFVAGARRCAPLGGRMVNP